MHLKQYGPAVEAFERANSMTRHDATFLQLGRVLQLQGNHKAALATYQEALEFSPDSPDLLTTLGLLHLSLGDSVKAFECFGSALTHDPRHTKSILAAGSIIQDNNDMVSVATGHSHVVELMYPTEKAGLASPGTNV